MSARRRPVILAVATAAALAAAAVPAAAEWVQAPGSPYTVQDDPYTVSAGRFSSDALTDLAVVNGTTSVVHVFDQKPGAAGFGLATGSPFAVGSGPNFAAVADFNGDGRDDIAVSNFVSQSISVELQQANGTFALEGNGVSVGDRSSAVATGDFNGDGRPDLVAAGWDTGTVKVLLRKGDNTGFTQSASFASGGTHPRDLAVGDLDGSGGADIAVTNGDSNNVAVFDDQGGGGNWTAATGSPYATGANPQYVVAAKLNADDKPDLAISNAGSSNVTVLDRATGTSFAPAPGSPYAVGAAPDGLAAADFRGTGRLDLVAVATGAKAFTILENDGTTFTRGADVPTGSSLPPQGVATGLFDDADTLPDIALTNVGAPGSLGVFLNRPAPKATTGDASDVTATSAKLNGFVDPRASDADAHFEYGTTVDYGSRAPGSGELPAGKGVGFQSLSRTLDGLLASTTYHFRIIASSHAGSATGEDRTFTTPAAAPPPTTGAGGPNATPGTPGGTGQGATPAPPGSATSGPPQAYLSAPDTVTAGTSTTLSAVGTTPATGLTYAFDLDGSGEYATRTNAEPSLETTFTSPGDVVVGLKVADARGRTDVVRRRVHVTAPPSYSVAISPAAPKPGDTVRFTVRELAPATSATAPSARLPLSRGSLSTMTFGDRSKPSATVGGLLIRDRAASASGTFSHVFKDDGIFRLHIGVDDGHGYQQGVDVRLPVGQPQGEYVPAISTASATVTQGSCVAFANATANRLSVDEVGAVTKRDVNPANRILLVKPDLKDIQFGGHPEFGNAVLTTPALSIGSIVAGSPLAHLQFLNPATLALGGRSAQARSTATPRQAEAVTTTSGTAACQQQANIENTVADAIVNYHKAPYPPGADKGWQSIPECTGGAKFQTYSTAQVGFTGTVASEQTTRHTWFSANRWDFGDGTKSDAHAFLPSYSVYHPFDKPGTFTVKLATTYPKDLSNQVKTWNGACASKPLNATTPDDRFATKTTQMSLRVKAQYQRITSRGLTMSAGSSLFDETDLPGVYETSGAIYLNTKRVGFGVIKDSAGNVQGFDFNKSVQYSDGVLVITPSGSGTLRVVPDQGEIIGNANLAWQSGGQTVALGPMPTRIAGTAGLVIPQPAGGSYDFGIFNDPPASLGSGSPPPKGAGFHINTAHVALRANDGGRLDLNVTLPGPLGPNGEPSSETVVRDVRGNDRARAATRTAKPRGLLDDVDVDIPPVELVPDIISFEGGKLSHHVGQNPPWQATGSLLVFHRRVDMSPRSETRACPVVGGLGFYEDGGLEHAGAAVTGLDIPIPSPPSPPVISIGDPAFAIYPGTTHSPLDLYGCVTLHDYPEGKAFSLTGCVGFLSAGDGISIPASQQIKFCPDDKGNSNYARTDHNSTPDPAHPGSRIMRGVVIRGTGTLGLGPEPFPVGGAYLEVRTAPFAIEAKGSIGIELLDGHIKVGGQVFGYIRSKSDWAIGGEGGITQDVLCAPIVGCPGVSASALVSSHGLGACGEIFGIGLGGSISFDDGSLHAHFPGCDLEDLQNDLGVSIRSLQSYKDLLRRPGERLAAMGATQSGGVELSPGSPYSLIVVKGTDRSPLVEVRDPSGKLVLDDSGAPVQGLKAPEKAPGSVDLAKQDPPAPDTDPGTAPQGIFHNDASSYADGKVDLRHTTMVLIRNPKKGKYTITAKAGSAPITAISHSNAQAPPVVRGGVVTGASGKKMLSVQAKLPAGSTLSVAEQGRDLNKPLTTLKAESGGAASRHAAFTPALGAAGMRKLIAVVSRDGIPQQQIVLGRYRAPGPPKTGAVRGLKVKRSGSSRVVLSWRPAANATKYVVRVKLKRGGTVMRTVPAKTHRVTIADPLVRLGVSVTVTPDGALEKAGPAARARVAPAKLRKIKRFVL